MDAAVEIGVGTRSGEEAGTLVKLALSTSPPPGAPPEGVDDSPLDGDASHATGRRGPESILVVDDAPVVRNSLARALRAHVRVETAADAASAIEALERQSFDAILTDYSMLPGSDGVWLLEQVAQRWPATRRVLMTGGVVPNLDQLLGSTVEIYFEKPVRMSELLRLLREPRK